MTQSDEAAGPAGVVLVFVLVFIVVVGLVFLSYRQ